MPIEITMPRLSDTMQQGTVVKWNVKEGDAVKTGQVLADIETDKATMELESFDSGVVAAIVAGEGQNVAVGSVIVVLAGKGEDAAAIKSQQASRANAPAVGVKASSAGANGVAAASPGSTTALADPPGASDHAPARDADMQGGRIFASPLARKLADDMGVDLARVRGTGPGGRIVKADIEQAAASPRVAPAGHSRPGSSAAAPSRTGLVTAVAAPSPMLSDGAGNGLQDATVALSNMRRTIAQRLVQSKTTIPHYQVTLSVNMDPLLALREQLNGQLSAQGVKLSVNDFLVRACALAMHQHPHVNSAWDESTPGAANIRLLGRVNVGVAISLPTEKGGGLVVATIRDADRLGLRAISTQTKMLAEKARTRGLTIEEMADSTFTISNLGMFGVEHFTAIINPPNAAILAVGAAVKRPVVRTVNGMDQVVIGHEMQMTMSSDHRIIDGAMAAQFLGAVKQLLESPATLLV